MDVAAVLLFISISDGKSKKQEKLTVRLVVQN